MRHLFPLYCIKKPRRCPASPAFFALSSEKIFSKNVHLLTLICLIFLALPGWAQQENQYTQFSFNKLYYNPAYAGARGKANITAMYRNQWLGFEGSPTSQMLSFHTPLFADRVGLGLGISNHRVGITNIWYANLAYSYHVKIKKHTSLRFGLQGTFKRLSLDFSDPSVIVREDTDPAIIESGIANKNIANFGAGVYLSYKSIYLGVSVPHFYPNIIGVNPNAGNNLIAQESPHIYLMGGAMIPAGKSFHIKPTILTKYVNGAPFDFDAQLSLVYQLKLHAGVSYRLGGDSESFGESIDFLLFYQFTKIGFGVSYDYTLSQIKTQSNGSIEAIVRYDFKKEKDDIANPRFFF